MSQAQNRERIMRIESSGKPDAWKLACPVWGWGRGETPRPTPLDLAALGKLSIKRASYVEPDGRGGWTADLSPVRGPQLGRFERRSEALEAEREWLVKNWLIRRGDLVV